MLLYSRISKKLTKHPKCLLTVFFIFFTTCRSFGNASAAYVPASPCKLNVPSFVGEDGDSTHRKRMCLKGQMVYIPETDKICFLCSPSVGCLEDLKERGNSIFETHPGNTQEV